MSELDTLTMSFRGLSDEEDDTSEVGGEELNTEVEDGEESLEEEGV